MAIFNKFCFILLVSLLFASFTPTAPQPSSVPAPTTHAPASRITPAPAPAPSPDTPAPAPDACAPASNSTSSVPNPPPPSKPYTPPTPSPHPPAPAKKSSGRLSGGQKTGIVLGVFSGVGVLGCCGMVYNKHRNNIRGSNYSHVARRLIFDFVNTLDPMDIYDCSCNLKHCVH